MHKRTVRPRPVPRWPVGHLGWAFAGLAEFEGRTSSFLAEGRARGERLIFVADDPRAGLWPSDLVERGALLVLSTAEVYGPERMVVASTQQATFEEALADALALGFTGLRVAADNTSLTVGADRLEAWRRWEEQADLLMQSRPITGLCAFDQTRIDTGTLDTVMSLHRTGPPPLFDEPRPPVPPEEWGGTR